MLNSRFRLVVISFFLMACVGSCGQSRGPQDHFDNYLYRLKNSLDTPSDLPRRKIGALDKLIRYPSARQLVHTLSATNINLIEFLSLSKCDLQRHIGQRNSSLGRLMKPSQQLIYEYEFIRLTEQCLLQLGDSSKLYSELSEVLRLKKQQLSRVQWNATFASEEFAMLFSLGAKPLTADSLKQKPSELYLALETLHLFLNNEVESTKDIETAYSVITSSKRMGELRLSMSMVIDYLSQADELLQYRTQQKTLCFNQMPNSQFEIVDTVFTKFYIGEIQPYIALLHQQTKIVYEKMDVLVGIAPPTDAFKVFWGQVYTAQDSEWQRFETAIKKHTQNWQTLLKQCGRLPS